MANAYVVTGTLTGGRTVTLDQGLPFTDGPVRVVVEPLPGKTRLPLSQFLAELRARQTARGHSPRTKDEIDEYIRGERNSWDDE
jgi:hypothetical protein